MRKILGIALVTMMMMFIATSAMANNFIVGEGKLNIQTLEQNFDSPPQLIVDWFRLRGVIALGWEWDCERGILIFCGYQEKADGEVILMKLIFKSAGLVARYRFVGEQFINGHIIFNGVGYFCFFRVLPDGSEEVLTEGATLREDGITYEHGKALIFGKASFSRNGIGRLVGVQVQGGNTFFLWRGGLQGSTEIMEEVN